MLRLIIFGLLVLLLALVMQGWFQRETFVKPVILINDTYDYIVVGAGSAGSVVATRLSENKDVTVLLIEAGDTDDTGSISTPGRMFENPFTDADWQYPLETPKHAHGKRDIPEVLSAGRVLGGGSSINYLQYIRGSRHDFDNWEKIGCPGWGYKDVLPYFLKSEDAQFPGDKRYHSTGGFLGVTETPNDGLYRYVLDAGKELGLEEVDYNGPNNLGVSKFYFTVKRGERSTPSNNLLRHVMTRDNLHVAVDTLAVKVVFKDKRAVGVDIIKHIKERTIMAKKEIILSSGAFGSPKLLMLSGVGHAPLLNKVNIPVEADLPVGSNLHYHYTIPLWVKTNHSEFRPLQPTFMDKMQYIIMKSGWLAEPITAAVINVRTDGKNEGWPDIQINTVKFRLPTEAFGVSNEPDINNRPGIFFGSFISHPKSTGSVKLQNHNPLDYPIIDLNYFGENSDIDVSIFNIRFVQKLLKTKAFSSINASSDISRIKACEHEQFDSDAYWECYIKTTVVSFHHAGTCKMGQTSDPTTVVDHRLRVKGVQGLRVIDASIMPFVTSGNTNAPIIMIGEKGADMILEDLKQV